VEDSGPFLQLQCATYAFKGNTLDLGNSVLSLKIDSSTNQLLTKLNDVEKKIDDKK